MFIDDVSVDDWAEMLPSIRRKLLGSRILVPVITPRFYESEHCRTELHLALLQSYWLDRGETARVLPVIWQIEPRTVRPRVLKKNKIPKAGKSPAQLAAEIKSILDEVKKTDQRRFGDAPEPSRPDWFPSPMVARPKFTGRSDELWELHDALAARDKPKDRGHPVVSVRGVGGQGKSTLVAQYALWFAEDHPGGVFVLELAGSDSHRVAPEVVQRRFDRGLEGIADALDIAPEEVRELGLRRVISRALRRRGPYLWIVDGVPSWVDPKLVPELWAPTSEGKTVFTTRGQLRELVSVELELGGLRPRDGLALLTVERRPDVREEVQAARQIVLALDAHPLGLRLAAGQTLSADFSGYSTLLSALRSTDREVLELTANLADTLPTGYVTTFSAALLRSYRHLTEAGHDILDAISVLASGGVARSLLVDLVTDTLGANRATTLDEGLTHLTTYGLATEQLDVSTDGEQVDVHPLVIRAVRFLSNHARRRRWRDAAIRVLTTRVTTPRTTHADDRQTALCLPHVDAAVGPLDAGNEWPVGADEWHLLNEAARVEYEIGNSHRSLAHFRSLIDACDASATCDEWTRLRLRVNLGAAHANYREYDTARQILEDVLSRLPHTDLEADPEVLALVTEVLGNCHNGLGEPDTAATWLKRAYRTRRRHLGPVDPRTLTTLNNLVIATGSRTAPRSWQLALRWALGAYALWHRSAGADTPGALDSMTSVGANLLRLDEVSAAHAVFDYVWQRRRELQGDLHPDTISAGENMLHARARLTEGSA